MRRKRNAKPRQAIALLAAAADIGANLGPHAAKALEHITADAGRGDDGRALRCEQAIDAVIRHKDGREQQRAKRRNDGNPKEQCRPPFRRDDKGAGFRPGNYRCRAQHAACQNGTSRKEVSG